MQYNIVVVLEERLCCDCDNENDQCLSRLKQAVRQNYKVLLQLGSGLQECFLEMLHYWNRKLRWFWLLRLTSSKPEINW